MFFYNHKKSTGFTLIELMVAIGIFMLAVSMGMGALLSMLDANSKSRTLSVAISNLDLAIESMSREIKFGKGYSSCSNPCTTISYIAGSGPHKGSTVTYALSGGQIVRSIDGDVVVPVTAPSPEMSIGILHFVVEDNVSGYQPRVTIVVQGNAGNRPGLDTSFVIQTTVSQRDLNF